MANILYPPPRPQSVGEILDLALRIFGATLVKCLPYSFAGVVLSHLTTMYDVSTGRPLVQTALQAQPHNGVWWCLFLVAMVGTVALTNAVLLRQYALATGHTVSAAGELATGLRRVPGVLAIGLLMGLAILVSFIPLAVLAWRLLGINPAGATAGFLWTLAGVYLLLLICASWVVVRWICAGAVYLLTDRGPVESMSYSWRLTSGSFWRLSSIYGVGITLIVVLYAIASVLGGVVAMVLAHGDVAVITASWAVVVTLLGAFVTPLYSALILAVFGDVSVRREGVDLAQRIVAPVPP